MFVSKAMEVFITLAQEENLQRAARKLCLTTPPVSRMLKNTEDWAGEKLITIERNRISLTPIGKKLYHDVLPHYLALKKIQVKDSRHFLTISSPQVYTSSITNIFNRVIPNDLTDISIKYSEDIRDDDDIFISFHHLPPPKHFSIDEMTLQQYIIGDTQLKEQQLKAEISVCRETLLSDGFQQALSELKKDGFTGLVRHIDNREIRYNQYIAGKSMIVVDQYHSKKTQGEDFTLRVYQQPIFIYKNKLSSNKYLDDIVSKIQNLCA